MTLYFAKDPKGNFGDDLNEIVWPRLIPGLWNPDPSHLFIGIGTILNERIPNAQRKTVFGAGYGYGALPRLHEGRWDFHVVRGPITAKALDLDPKTVVTDPGILVRRIFQNGSRPRTQRVSFMPHHITDQNADWATICEQAGIQYISPRAPLDQVAEAIDNSERLLTEAMHGAIAADAFRVPWKALEIFDGFNQEKWCDWCLSMELDYSAVRIPQLWGLERLQSTTGRLKNLLKRSLHGSPLWSAAWSSPLRRDSDEATRSLVVQQLKAAAASAGFRTSKDSVLDDRLTELEARLARLKLSLEHER